MFNHIKTFLCWFYTLEFNSGQSTTDIKRKIIRPHK